MVDTPDPPLTGESPDVPGEYALQGFDGVQAYATDDAASSAFLAETLDMEPAGKSRWEARGTLRGGWYQLDPAPSERRRFGGGVVQHIAWGCLPEDIESWSERVDPLCPDATGIIDRHFFRSTYFTEPGGVLFEIAEHGGPGFAIGEPDMQRMGDELQPSTLAGGAAQALRMVADARAHHGRAASGARGPRLSFAPAPRWREAPPRPPPHAPARAAARA